MEHNPEAGSEGRALALVVEREPAIRAVWREVLEPAELTVLEAESTDEAEEILHSRTVHLLIADLARPTAVPPELLERVLRVEPSPVVVALAGPDITDAGQALVDGGVHEVVLPPLQDAVLRRAAGRAVIQVQLCEELRRLRRALQSREGYHEVVGRSPAMERLREEVDRLAALDSPVWLAGEPGTGKELTARSLHAHSARAGAPFVLVHCAGLAEAVSSSAEVSEGALLQAWLEQAEGGTLYLDGVTELPLAFQQGVDRIARKTGRAGVRLTAGALTPPQQAVENGLLIDALAVSLGRDTLQLPTLVERAEDIALLAQHFVSIIGEINHLPSIRLSPDAMGLLELYPWPGNVRELRNAMEHAVILAVDRTILPRDLPERVRDGGAGGDPATTVRLSSRKFRDAKREVVGSFEESYLSELLERHRGNVTVAAQHAGMLRSALQRLLRKYGLRSMDFRRPRAARREQALATERAES